MTIPQTLHEIANHYAESQVYLQDNLQDETITDGGTEEAPMPLPNPLPKVMQFNPEMLPKSIREYVCDVTMRQQCPIDFIAVTAVCGLSAVLGKKALISPKQNDDWRVTPNLWGALIGPPSAMKTPAMQAALKPLRNIDADAIVQYKKDKDEYEINKEFADLNKKTTKEEARKLNKKGNSVEAKAKLKAACFKEEAPKRKRLIVNDATVEKLGELLNENPNGLILVRDELAGWLAMLAREENQTDRAFYLECFNGNGPYAFDRIGRGTIDINSTTLSVIGGIQPSRISPLIREAVRGIADDGLIQRLQLSVWPDNPENWKWVDLSPNEVAYNDYEQAFKKLHQYNGDGICFKFNDKAIGLFREWMEETQKIARSEETHPALQSHLLKMPATVASLALLFQILDNLENEITSTVVKETAICQALEWADYLKSHAERLYSIATNIGLGGAHLILARIEKLNDEFTARDIVRKCWTGLTDIRSVEEALEFLVDYQHLIPINVTTSSSGGRPTTLYRKNKKHLNGGAK